MEDLVVAVAGQDDGIGIAAHIAEAIVDQFGDGTDDAPRLVLLGEQEVRLGGDSEC